MVLHTVQHQQKEDVAPDLNSKKSVHTSLKLVWYGVFAWFFL